MLWKLINSGCQSAGDIMKKDRELLSELSTHSTPILHLYRWKGVCATYGYFIQPYDFLDKNGVESANLELAQRPTGGGILFHLTDLAFSILIPPQHEIYVLNTLESYAYINNRVLEGLSDFISSTNTSSLLNTDKSIQNPSDKAFCMARPTQYDIMIDGKKVGGAAQRKTKNGLLHQGSIFLCPPPDDFLKTVLFSNSNVSRAIQNNSGSLVSCNHQNLDSIRTKIQQNLIKLFFR